MRKAGRQVKAGLAKSSLQNTQYFVDTMSVCHVCFIALNVFVAPSWTHHIAVQLVMVVGLAHGDVYADERDLGYREMKR